MSNNNEYFVKFVPCNKKTLSSIINKTIYFSTVYDFNDFNELIFIPNSTSGNQLRGEKIMKMFKKCYHNMPNNTELLKHAETNNYKREFLNELESFLANLYDDPKFDEKFTGFMLEHIVYSTVGIFCLSHIDVFDNANAQVMFAHYGANLKGLALIYEINCPQLIYKINKNQKVDYIDLKCKKESNMADFSSNIPNWLDGNFDKTHDFRKKLKIWDYEMEHRIFEKPGIKPLPEGISLKAILYTPRFDSNDLRTLRQIIDEIYKGKVSLKKINQNLLTFYTEKSYFTISEGDQPKSIKDWLNGLS